MQDKKQTKYSCPDCKGHFNKDEIDGTDDFFKCKKCYGTQDDIEKLINEVIGEEDKSWTNHSSGNYCDGARDALMYLKDKTPELAKKIMELIFEKHISDEVTVNFDGTISDIKQENI